MVSTQPVTPFANESDADLVRQTRDGRNAAFDLLVDRYNRRAYSAAYRLLGDAQDALDVTQDAFVRAYRRLDSLKDVERFPSWLMRIVTNHALNFRRSRGTGQRMASLDGVGADGASLREELPSASGDCPVVRVSAAELAVQAKAAVAALPRPQRLALVLSSIEGMPQREVAEIMKCSVEAVKWHVFQARKRLRLALADYL